MEEGQNNVITELEAEISELRGAPAPEGHSRRALRQRADYYKQILDLYAEREDLLQRRVQEMREERAHNSESKLSKLMAWR